MPIFSTKSSVFLNPAVSNKRTGTPVRSRVVSNTSRVVPGTSVTIAASRRAIENLIPTRNAGVNCTYLNS